MAQKPQFPAVIYVVWDSHGVGVIFDNAEEAAQAVVDWGRDFADQGPFDVATYDVRGP